jgi:hypothetical protein
LRTGVAVAEEDAFDALVNVEVTDPVSFAGQSRGFMRLSVRRTTDPIPPTITNIALGRNVTEFSTQQTGNEAVKINDGIENTDNNRWAASGYPQWVVRGQPRRGGHGVCRRRRTSLPLPRRSQDCDGNLHDHR